jgi:leukotriene-A4 hydrolase
MARLDPHSYADLSQARTEHLTWTARVSFEERVLHCTARLQLAAAAAGGPFDLDTRELVIDRVTDDAGEALRFELAAAEPIFGSRLRIDLPAGATAVRISYRTSPSASALQWLTPAQTTGGKHPYLFSQCQAIHARSVVPLQDSPRVRLRYTAAVELPKALRALMAAGAVGREEKGAVAVERFEMPQAIPPYLFAFAVGNLASRELGPRSRVWAEPEVVDAAAREFAGVDAMLTTAEKLFGPYDWDRFDVLTMPQSFPYGGMENPRLTFLTPTVIAGDRSLVSVLVHELAHSWTGNLVSNADGDHFWLNEGFTVFAERRILEALEGAEVAGLQAALGRRELEKAVERFADRPELTRLRTSLTGIDPDDAYSEVPYEKGYLFLRTLEEAVGREAFTAFLRKYVGKFRFQSITTEDFEAFCEAELQGALAKVGAQEWLRGTGIPANAPTPRSAKLDAVKAAGATVPTLEATRPWMPTEWTLYLENLPHPAPLETCRALDERFALTKSRNYEVLVSWLRLAADSGYAPARERTEEVLGEVGRMKYLKPLYTALAQRPETKGLARQIFTRLEGSYHPIAQTVVKALLTKHGA